MPAWLLGMLKTKAAIAVIAVVSIGGVAAGAAVSDGTGEDPALGDTTTTTAPADTTTTTVADEGTTTTTLASVEDPVDGPAVEPADECLNHGQRVSAVARSTPGGPDHGAVVSEAAHDHEGECNRVDDDEADEPESEPVEVEDSDDVDEPEQVEPAPVASETGGSSGNHGGNHGGDGNGRGHG